MDASRSHCRATRRTGNIYFAIQAASDNTLHTHARTHAHTHPFNGPLSVTTQVNRYQKGKTNLWILLKQETVSGSGISWAICKSAPRSRQITTPAPHHSVLPAACPSCRPTNSVKALKANQSTEVTCITVMIINGDGRCGRQLQPLPGESGGPATFISHKTIHV